MDLDLEGRDEAGVAEAAGQLGVPQWISTWRVETRSSASDITPVLAMPQWISTWRVETSPPLGNEQIKGQAPQWISTWRVETRDRSTSHSTHRASARRNGSRPGGSRRADAPDG